MFSKKTLIPASIIVMLFACNDSSNRNRLAEASSPYLRDHADNPVDWYEWKQEALDKAKKENKPLLISIGYASCHWCHEMEKESFMDTTVARIMNENFICIKVDREERPDIDNIYMNACQLITGGNGGWPLNAFALPDGKPFFAGTYYTKENWINLLNQVANAYKSQYNKVQLQADALTSEIINTDLIFLNSDQAPEVFSKTDYRAYFDSLSGQIDFRNGGLKGSPKFPMPSVWEFFLQYHYLNKDTTALNAVVTTLKKMALGGIYDHVGGGFARYSTDSVWHIPHFEKMLYDNGQLMSLYAHAYQVTKIGLFRDVVYGIGSFVQRDLTSPEGGFYSSLNADTEAGEGEFYAWKYDDIKKLFGNKDGDLVAVYYNIIPAGNWENGRNILYVSESTEEFRMSGKNEEVINDDQLKRAKELLLLERNKRPLPATDNKILTAWNALMLKGFLDAYAAFGDSIFLKSALQNAVFLEKKMLRSDGQLWRNYVKGKVSITGFLDDYALLARSYIRLYQLTFDKHWLDLARKLADYSVKNFYNNDLSVFYYTSTGSEKLVIRKIEVSDNVIPSSNALMAEVLYNLGIYFENGEYLKKMQLMFSKIAGKMYNAPPYYSQWGYLGGLAVHNTYEVAVMGREALRKNIELQRHYLPVAFIMGHTDREDLPLLENKLPDDKTLIYVCTNRVCKLPVEAVNKALEQIK